MIDLKLAVQFARLIIDAYEEFSNGELNLPDGYELVAELIEKTDFGHEHFGFVATCGDSTYVVFRGVDSFADGLEVLQARHVRCPFPNAPGCCEKGVARVYESVRDQLFEALRQSVLDTSKLYVMGHSLGGSVAMLAALDIKLNLELDPTLYTIAAMRPGGFLFARGFNKVQLDSYRIYNRNDIVPHMPPAVLNYRQTRAGFRIDFHGGSVLGNHRIANYLHALEKLLSDG